MEPWLHLPSRTTVVAVIFCALIQATSQEIWVAVENRLQSTQGDEIIVPGARYLSGLAIQDATDGPIFWTTDAGKDGAGLYRVQKNRGNSLVYRDPESTYFESVVHNPSSQSIYLTAPTASTILRVDNTTKVMPVLRDKTKKPSGLAHDPCTRSLFWTNTARGSATIEVIRDEEVKKEELGHDLQSRVLVSSNLTRPRGLTLDIPEGMLYWADQVKNEFSIWRVGVSGSEDGRGSLVCRGRGSEPFSLLVTGQHIYWTDWASHALYRTEKNGNCSVEMVSRFKSSKPNGLAGVEPSSFTCDKRREHNDKAAADPSNPLDQDVIDSSKSDAIFLSNETSTTNLAPNARCGSPWEYYCLQGSCMEMESLPLCLCSPGWEGDRCDKEKPGLLFLSPGSLELMVVALAILSLLLLGSLIVVSVILHRYRKRPRIVRKRFISVAKDSKQNGSFDSGSSSSCGLPLEQGIQLDIENCCNMTLCDTPCFEPPSRVPNDLAKPSRSCSSRSTKPDRKALLDCDDNEDDLLF